MYLGTTDVPFTHADFVRLDSDTIETQCPKIDLIVAKSYLLRRRGVVLHGGITPGSKETI